MLSELTGNMTDKQIEVSPYPGCLDAGGQHLFLVIFSSIVYFTKYSCLKSATVLSFSTIDTFFPQVNT